MKTKPPAGRQFPKGVSGNPGGRPKELREVIELARAHAPDAVETLAEIMKDTEAPPAARAAAANSLLDRAYGKPVQAIEAKTEEMSFIQLVQQIATRPPPPPPAHLGEIMTVEKFRAIEAGKIVGGAA